MVLAPFIASVDANLGDGAGIFGSSPSLHQADEGKLVRRLVFTQVNSGFEPRRRYNSSAHA
jgi:hypothetical protein